MTTIQPDPKRRIALIYLGLAILTVLLYLPMLRHDFINYDDPDYILSNAHEIGRAHV